MNARRRRNMRIPLTIQKQCDDVLGVYSLGHPTPTLDRLREQPVVKDDRHADNHASTRNYSSDEESMQASFEEGLDFSGRIRSYVNRRLVQ